MIRWLHRKWADWYLCTCADRYGHRGTRWNHGHDCKKEENNDG